MKLNLIAELRLGAEAFTIFTEWETPDSALLWESGADVAVELRGWLPIILRHELRASA